MALTNFDFPGVTLKQVFAEASTGTTSTLSVACIGPQFALHRADVESEAAMISQASTAYDVTNGLTTASLPGKGDGTLDTTASTHHLVVKNGVWSYATKSGTLAAGGVITFAVVLKDGGGYTADAAFGSRGVRVGDYVYVTDSASTPYTKQAKITAIDFVSGSGYIKATIDSAASLATGEVSVKFCLVQAAKYASGNSTFTLATTGVTIQGGLTTTLAELGGVSGTLQAGDFYVEYRERYSTWNNKLGVIEKYGDVESILGGASAENPLALAVKFALLGGNNTAVYFTTVASDTAAAYEQAVDLLAKYPQIYSIVPATTDTAVIQAVAAACIADSEDIESKIRRICWYGINSKTLGSGETNADLIDDLITKRAVSSYRARCIWADDIVYNGEVVGNYAGAAAAAGLSSYEECWRPLSNLGYNFFSVADTHGLTRSQLKQLGSNGIWIIGNNADNQPVNLKQVTTAVANNLNLDEHSIVANADECCLMLCHVGENQVGCSNISTSLLAALETTIYNALDKRTKNASSAYVGNQLISYEIVRIYQDTVNLDHVYADINIEPPKPFNKFHITVRVI